MAYLVEDGEGACHADLANTNNADLVGWNLLLGDDELHQLVFGGRHFVLFFFKIYSLLCL